MSKIIVIVAFIAAVVSAAIFASLFSSHIVYSQLIDLGVQIPFSTRISSLVADLGILGAFIPLMGVAFLLGFLVAKFVVAKTGGNKVVWYALAGASSWLVAIFILEAVFGLMPIGGARSIVGLMLQSLAGLIGGVIFVKTLKIGEQT